MYEFKTYHPPDCPHQQGSETSGTGYEVKAKTFSAERLISADIEAERLELERAERAINPRDRAAIEWAVKRGADELRVHAPRVRFFEKSSKFDFDAVLYRTHPGEIWVSADKPWYKQVEARAPRDQTRLAARRAEAQPRVARERRERVRAVTSEMGA